MRANQLILFSIVILGLLSFQQGSPKEIKWDFKKFKKLTYYFYQIVESQSPFGMDENMFNETKGTLIVSVKESGKADIIFKNVEVSMFSISEKGDTNRMMAQTAPDFFMQDMDEYGRISGRLNQQTELLAQVLFPIPTEKLRIGDKSKLPTSMPFNMFGSKINVTGINEITLNSIDNDIATLSSELDVSEYEIPEDANVNYDCYMEGNSEYSFDLSKGYFKTANLKITMAAKPINNEDEEEDESTEVSEMMKKMSKEFEMDMNTAINLKLKKAE